MSGDQPQHEKLLAWMRKKAGSELHTDRTTCEGERKQGNIMAAGAVHQEPDKLLKNAATILRRDPNSSEKTDVTDRKKKALTLSNMKFFSRHIGLLRLTKLFGYSMTQK